MTKKQSRNFYSGGRYGSRYKTTVTMGKKFTTKAGRYGCYVYVNGRRSHFEEDPDAKARREYRR